MYQSVFMFSFLYFSFINGGAYAIDCYSCYNLNEGPCFNFSTTTNLTRSEILTCSVHSRNLEYEMRRIYGPNFEHKTQSVLDIRCVQYEKYYYLTKSKEVFRGCIQKKYAREFCEKQISNQEYYYYNLTACNVCSTDMCNLGLKITPTNSYLTLFIVTFILGFSYN